MARRRKAELTRAAEDRRDGGARRRHVALRSPKCLLRTGVDIPPAVRSRTSSTRCGWGDRGVERRCDHVNRVDGLLVGLARDGTRATYHRMRQRRSGSPRGGHQSLRRRRKRSAGERDGRVERALRRARDRLRCRLDRLCHGVHHGLDDVGRRGRQGRPDDVRRRSSRRSAPSRSHTRGSSRRPRSSRPWSRQPSRWGPPTARLPPQARSSARPLAPRCRRVSRRWRRARSARARSQTRSRREPPLPERRA